MTEVVHRMHRACAFFIRPQSDYALEDIDHASADLYIFAQCMELTFGVGPALTSNLHVAVCRLARQCKTRGPSFMDGELWIERCVNVGTRVLGTSIPYMPEGLIAKRLLYDDALMELAGKQYASRDESLDLDVLRDANKESVWIQ